VVAGLGLGTASMVLGPVDMPGAAPEPVPAPQVVPPEAPVDEVTEEAAEPEAPVTPDAGDDAAPDMGDEAPDAETPPPAEEAEGDGAPQEAMPEMEAPVESPQVGADGDAGAEADASEMSAPEAEGDDEAAPVVPEAEPDAQGEAAGEDDEPGSPDAPAIETEADSEEMSGAVEPMAEAEPQAALASAGEGDAPGGPEPAPADEAAPALAPMLQAEPTEPDPAPAPEPEAEPAAPAPEVVIGRLPSIGGETTAQDDTPARAPAIERNAVAFTAPQDLPLMAMLLIDTGDDRAGFADLGKLPFPVAVAIDASALDAAEATAFYRDQGLEVVTILPLPEGATAADIEINLEAYAPLLEASVAAMAEETLGFQALGEGAVQLAVNLAETGHGLVSYPAGLNTGHKAAQKEGVPAGLVFRDLDAEGQGGAVIRRFLDNAAFRARNESQVIVVARTREETVQALLEWSLGTRATSVTLAPISAVLGAH